MRTRVQLLNQQFGGSNPIGLGLVLISASESYELNREARALIQVLHDSLGDVAKDLIVKIRVAMAHSKSSLFRESYAEEYFLELANLMGQESLLLKSVLGETMTLDISGFVERFPELACRANRERISVLRRRASQSPIRPKILLRTSALRRRAVESFRDFQDEPFDVIENLRDVLNSELLQDSRLVLADAPAQFLAKPQFAKYFRKWVNDASVDSIEFLVPQWAPPISENTFNQFLFSGLNFEGKWKFQIFDEQREAEPIEPISDDDFIDFDDSTSTEFSATGRELDKISLGGDIECIVVRCGGGLGFPVQAGATSVSGIAASDLDSSEPKVIELNFRQLSAGDVIVARVDSSEQVALRARVLARMGQSAEVFVLYQNRWKTLLRSKNVTGDWAGVSLALSRTGLSVEPRPGYWAEELSFGPRAAEDFVKLLSFLGIPEADAIDALQIRNAVWSESIREGQLVRTALQQSLTDEHYVLLRQGKAVEIENPDLGDANYVFTPVREVPRETVKLKSAQVRKFVVVE